jgi:hypothetical protein
MLAAPLVALLAVMAGCANKPIPLHTEDPAEVALQASMARVNAPAAFTNGADEKVPAPKMSGQSITVSYQGNADVLLAKIARARDMSFKVQGPRPFLPLPVHVDLVDVTLGEFLADVGHQFGQRADLVLTDKAIEIRYRGQP